MRNVSPSKLAKDTSSGSIDPPFLTQHMETNEERSSKRVYKSKFDVSEDNIF
jgi:hypothetical protein